MLRPRRRFEDPRHTVVCTEWDISSTL